jgi:phenylalanyl-tRNA synthetase beta chain
MLDLGQPNHTFDRRRLAAGIEIRMARNGETIQTLDGASRTLAPSDLLICSGDEPVALAGIMGGEASKVGADTGELLLEVATFDPVVVRRTSSRLGLRTDSSARFEKSLDPTLPLQAVGHFARLLRELQPDVRFPSSLTDVGAWKDPARTLHLRTDRARGELGTEIPDEQIGAILARLGFGVRAAGEGLDVDVPSARATKDVTVERDLVEEIGRIHRYGNITERPLRGDIVPPRRDARRGLVRRIQDRLAGTAHFHEALSYSFVDDALLEKLGLQDLPHVVVVNPAAQGQDKVRRSVLPSLLPSLEANRRSHDDVRLFEVGKGYLPEAANERGEPRERHLVGLVWAARPPGKRAAYDAARFSQLHGTLADLLDHLQIENVRWREAEIRPTWAHPTRALEALAPDVDEPLAIVAELEPAVLAKLGLSGELASDVAAAEVSIDALLAARKRGSRYRAIPRFPGIKVDVAVALAEAAPARSIEEAIASAGKGLVASVELFDLYRGDNIGADRKSLAYHVLLQSDSKTLTDKDEQKFLKRFEDELTKIQAELRKG